MMGKSERDGTEGQDAAPRRSYVTLPLAQIVPGLTRTAFRKRSPAAAAVMAEWVSIVGPALAGQTAPRKLHRGTLTIACAGPVALELQHLQAALIGRINAAAGAGTVEQLRFIQDTSIRPPPLPPQPRAQDPGQPPPALDGVADGPLRQSLTALFQALRQAAPPRRD